MILTNENYFSQEAQMEYFGSSQELLIFSYKDEVITLDFPML